ncbi:hypothetical protein F5Y13DRAFT_174443 [Hypoxylon sp. FL1857]|nr:hypothetical protein F5Y13DRAFT_174443 [Hypoxylon sp. FL1857]
MDQDGQTKLTTSRSSSADDTISEEWLEEYIRAACPAIDTETGTGKDTDTENEVPTSTSTSNPASSSSTTTIPRPSKHQDTPKTARPKPVLRKGRTNRILLYNGCFNPPHQGHLAHLAHAYRHSGPDLNIVGALVLVAGDQYIRWKARRTGDTTTTLLLSEAQRIALWNRELRARDPSLGGGGGWCWVVPEDMWIAISKELEILFRMDGFEVEYVRLAGGDKIGVRSVEHGVWGCRMTITTDVSRPVEFCEESGDMEAGAAALKLKALAGHTQWEKLQFEQEDDVAEGSDAGTEGSAPEAKRSSKPDSRRHGDSMTASTRDFWAIKRNPQPPAPSSTYADAAKNSAPATSKRTREVWVCKRGQYTLRFVPSTRGERVSPLSSTWVRDTIAGASYAVQESTRKQELLEDILRGEALSPELLAQYIREKFEK